MWLSTQATVNVLDALNALSPVRGQGGTAVAASQSESSAAQTVEVFVNGRSAGTVILPATRQPANPVSLDLSRLVATGGNRVEIKRTSGAILAASAQLVTTYYRPWSAAVAGGTYARPQDSRALNLKVEFDRTTAATGDAVTCRISAKRVGHRATGCCSPRSVCRRARTWITPRSNRR